MNTNLASYIMGMVIDENDRFYFVQKDGQTYALDKAEGPHQVGESVKGFAYADMKQKLRLTTLEVTATQESFGWGRSQKCARIWESLWIQGFQISRLLSH